MTDAWLRFAAIETTQLVLLVGAVLGFLSSRRQNAKAQITPEQLAEDVTEVKGDVKKLHELMLSHILDHNGGKGIRW